MASSSKRTPPPGKNRLAFEKSPYLLQHADNPVDWYPWGDEAFERAKREDKPVFLSIGYSTCHWCHVMQHESFEDAGIASLMNDAFVNVKVDREERPDIDAVYMPVCQMVRGNGGWPLTVIMTPEGKPFFIATYLPKTARHGLAGMSELVPQIKAIWEGRRDEVHRASREITEQVQRLFVRRPGETGPGDEALTRALEELSARFDSEHGGFSGAPKFPSPHTLLFLLRRWRRAGEHRALVMVEETLDHMARGGICDHVGFGFHRYSTDERWFAPHFEKMIYDQALISMAYTECYLATGNERWRRVAEEILAYAARDMTDPKGGFYSAEDADSEGTEGKFYLWTEKEIFDLLGEDDGLLVVDLYGVEPSGNFSKEVDGANILFLKRPIDEAAAGLGIGELELRERLERARRVLFEARKKRVRPGKDDKILVDWNGLMIASLSLAARAFQRPRHAVAAAKAARFILATMRTDEGRLYHRYRDGESRIPANLDDYAFLVWGLIELYGTTFDAGYLRAAVELTEIMNRCFWDGSAGGFYFTPDDGEAMIVRTKEIYDGAHPSGNSVAMYNLVRLARITGETRFEEQAEKIGRAFYEDANRAPSAFTFLMTAIETNAGPSREIVIVGDPNAADTKAIMRAVHSAYAPETVVLLKSTLEADPEITWIAPFTRPHTPVDGRTAAYLCEDYACGMPTTDPKEVAAFVRRPVRR